MGNFAPLGGYPFGVKAQLSHNDVNTISEDLVKCPNATDGSSHAPSADLEWSSSSGPYGFSFDTVNPFVFKGKLDVLAGITFTSTGGAASGSCTFDANVATTISNATFSASATFNTGTTTTFNGTATCTFGSSTTLNLSGSTLVRGTLTIKSSGGPGAFILESGCAATLNGTTALNGNTSIGASCVITAASGAALAGALNSTCTINQSQPITFSSGVIPALSPVRTWHRRARLYAATLDTAIPQGVVADSPLFAAPSIYSLMGSASAVYLYLEFDPPHGGVITAVAVRSVVNSNPLGAFTRATYELVRWDNGLDAAAISLSSVATDAHAAGGGDWNTVLTTNLSAISSAQVDRTHDYGIRVTAPRVGGNSLDQWYDVLVTGTIDELNGQ